VFFFDGGPPWLDIFVWGADQFESLHVPLLGSMEISPIRKVPGRHIFSRLSYKMLPVDITRLVFLYARSPTAWLIYDEFCRRERELADELAHDAAAEAHYARLAFEEEAECFANYLQLIRYDEDEDEEA
jgi:hypothetical protein